ncbi:MAG: hypothetical protein HY903_09380 [Deltaproteobacteria bacterium]|nr:hypothetical protein [Deltaproteobacteria bacterium]
MGRGGRPPAGGRPPTHGLRPPAGRGRGQAAPSRHPETERHAAEVKATARGLSTLIKSGDAEKRPPAFDSQDLLVVRSWCERRPIEPQSAASALVRFPRLWSTKRGRYCRFRAPGAGAIALLRARPTF